MNSIQYNMFSNYQMGFRGIPKKPSSTIKEVFYSVLDSANTTMKELFDKKLATDSSYKMKDEISYREWDWNLRISIIRTDFENGRISLGEAENRVNTAMNLLKPYF